MSDSTNQPHPPGWKLDPQTNQWHYEPTEATWTVPPAEPPPPSYIAAPPAEPVKRKRSKGKIIAVIVAAVVALFVIISIASATTNNGSGGPTNAAAATTTAPIPTPTVIDETAAPTTEDTSTSEITNLALGTRVDVSDDTGAEGWVKVSKVAIGYVEYDPASHGRYVKVFVTYHCTTGTLDYNEFDWSVTNRAQREYESSTFAEDGLNSGTLHKGRTTSGWVYFDVSKSPVTTVSYVPNYSGDPLASWTVHI